MTSSDLLMHTNCHINRQLVYQYILMTRCILSTRLATITEQGQMKSEQLSHTNRGANQAPLMQYTTLERGIQQIFYSRTLWFHSQNSIFLGITVWCICNISGAAVGSEDVWTIRLRRAYDRQALSSIWRARSIGYRSNTRGHRHRKSIWNNQAHSSRKAPAHLGAALLPPCHRCSQQEELRKRMHPVDSLTAWSCTLAQSPSVQKVPRPLVSWQQIGPRSISPGE